MLASRTFQVILVSPAKPVGFSFALRVDKTTAYRGDEVGLRLE
jgi:hypothetical protein